MVWALGFFMNIIIVQSCFLLGKPYLKKTVPQSEYTKNRNRWLRDATDRDGWMALADATNHDACLWLAEAVIRKCAHVYISGYLTKKYHSVTFRGSGIIMDFFVKLMRAFRASPSGVDFITALPVEIAEMILLKLDSRSLLNVAIVSRKWMNICKGSSRLRKTARHHLRKKKRRMIQDELAFTKGSKTQTVSRTTRMQTDLAQRISRQGSTASFPVFSGATGVMKTSALNSRSKNKKSVSRVPLIPTRSSLKLR